MATCEKCQAQVGDGVKFCPSCGAAISAPQQTPQMQESPQATQTQAPPQQAQQTDFGAKLQELNNTADTTGQFDSADITQNKTMAILAYFGPLVLVTLFGAPASKFARFHAGQGLNLFLAEIAFGIVFSVVRSIVLAISLHLYFLLTILNILWLVFTVLAIIGIMNAANGKAKELPIIGKFKILK